jgi:hypothetical protein
MIDNLAAQEGGRAGEGDPNKRERPHEIEPARPDDATPSRQTEFEPPKRDVITTDIPTESPLERPEEIPPDEPMEDPLL